MSLLAFDIASRSVHPVPSSPMVSTVIVAAFATDAIPNKACAMAQQSNFRENGDRMWLLLVMAFGNTLVTIDPLEAY